MELTTKQKGDITEIQCILELKKLGYRVSLPYGEDSPYDLIFEDLDGKLLKVQCKTSRDRNNGAFSFKCCSDNHNKTENKKLFYTDTIDYFMTYFNNKAYLIPIGVSTTNEMSLRYELAKSNRTVGVNWAPDYELSKVLSKDGLS